MYYQKRLLIIFVLLLIPITILIGNSQKILINEFLTSNATGIVDEDGDYSDWIELYNTTNTPINLSGWGITDNINKPKKWIFPSIVIKPYGYMIIFASGKDKIGANNEVHTNFSLSREGEYLGVIEPRGMISDEYRSTYPPQHTDISYGYYEGERMYFSVPTPGRENTLDGPSFPMFSHTRGYYNEPITVTLTTNDPDTRIYYSVDGTPPSVKDNLYTEPLLIGSTTSLSVVGYKNGFHTKVDSHTYFFIDDIIRQDENPVGYPDRWGILGGSVKYEKYPAGDRAPAHYGMEQSIIDSPDYQSYLTDAFFSIPSVSIVTKPDYLFSDLNDEEEGGIYIYPRTKGWERPISLEYFDPKTKKEFQVNCGLRIHGGASREPEKAGKHSVRAYFRKAYGAGKLRDDVFEIESAVKSFDHLLFRAGFNHSWVHWSANDQKNSQYVIDSFAKKTQLKMGHVSAHNRFVHLYINGLYWGLYDMTERVRKNFMASYFGGKDTDYDVLNHGGLVDGSRSDFNRMVSLAEDGKLDDLISENLLELDNYIDYLLLNFYLGNTDWGDNNWYGGRNREEKTDGFRFFIWDAESSFFRGVNFNTMLNAGRFRGPLRKIIFGADDKGFDGGLHLNEDFRMIFADRVQKHLFNGGALTPESTSELFNELSDIIDLAIILESARWGSYRRNTLPGDGKSPIYNRNDFFIPQKEKILKEYFPYRTEIFFNQLKDLGLASTIKAPSFSVRGGEFFDPFDLEILSENGRGIYYTVDGTDPRTWGSGTVSESAIKYSQPILINSSMDIKARVKRDDTWSALSDISFLCASSSDIHQIEGENLKVFCRDDYLVINVPYIGEATINVYSLDGKSIFGTQKELMQGENNFYEVKLQQGLYLIRVHYMGKSFTHKIVKH